jgi:uncharacterized protein YkwD
MRIGFIVLLLLLQGFQERARSVEQRVFAEINEVRGAHQVAPLRWNARIAEQARHHSERMAGRHFMSHYDPEFGGPGDRLSRVGIAWRACAENIYQDSGYRDPARSATQSWMESSGHRKNLLSGTYTDTGIGVAIGARGEHIITQIFAAF